MPIGIDILKISRLEKSASDPRFLKKLFSEKEKELFRARNFNLNTVAGNFCAKEALAKATGLGLSKLPLTEISILRDDVGRPYFEFSSIAKNILKMYSLQNAEVTISHDNDMAAAVVFIGEDENYRRFVCASEKSNIDKSGVISLETAKKLLPVRGQNTHKGDFGRVFAIAGSTGFTGAARLASEAMLRCGSGLITLGCPKSLNNIFEVTLKEVMTYPLADNDGILTKNALDKILSFLQKCDVCLVGCGMSNTEDTQFIVEGIINNFDKTIIIDADGINALSVNINVLKNHRQNIVLTPHLAEFARLIGKDVDFVIKNEILLGLEFAEKYNVCLVLKSHRTKVILPNGSVFENVLGNSGMATGGSGDVLAGIIASFVGQNMSYTSAALLGVYVHSLAADMAAMEKCEYSLTPTDIINNIAYTLKYLGG